MPESFARISQSIGRERIFARTQNGFGRYALGSRTRSLFSWAACTGARTESLPRSNGMPDQLRRGARLAECRASPPTALIVLATLAAALPETLLGFVTSFPCVGTTNPGGCPKDNSWCLCRVHYSDGRTSIYRRATAWTARENESLPITVQIRSKCISSVRSKPPGVTIVHFVAANTHESGQGSGAPTSEAYFVPAAVYLKGLKM
jgi:hypothetical protein